MGKLKLVGGFMLIAALVSGCGQSEVASQTNTVVNESSTSQEEIVSKENTKTENEGTETEEVKQETDSTKENTPKEESSEAPKTGGALPRPALTAQELVATAYGSDDPYIAFKEEFTQNYLDKVNKMYSQLDESYMPSYDDDAALYVKEDSTSFGYLREVQSDDMAGMYKYIMKLNNDMGFCDASDELYAWQSFNISLCDEDKDGKIELDDKVFDMIQTFYSGVSLDKAEIQAKINQAIEAEKNQTFDLNLLDIGDKYYESISFDWLVFEDYPLEIQITGGWYQDYPIK